MRGRTAVLVFFFLLGAYAVGAQATLLREAQVLLFGSELAWGLVLAFWLAGVAVGAQASGRILVRSRRPWIVLLVSALAMPPILAAEILLLRAARPILGVEPGEYVGLGDMAWVALLATAPVSLWVGLAFPAASALVGADAQSLAQRARSVGWAYLVESAGSLVGGALFSFVLVGRISAFTLTAGGGALLAAGAAAIARERVRWRPAALLFLACAAVRAGLILGGVTAWLDSKTVQWRWRSFAPGLDLVESVDSKYQNIAVGRLGNQFSLYTNGTVAATWPNHTDLAIEAHLAACEHPAPKRILVLGGGAEGLLGELERHRPERLDYVTLDRAEYEAVVAHLDDADRLAAERLRAHTHFADARRYVKSRRACPVGAGTDAAPRYDLVVLAAPPPASTLEARLYTEEFFAELSRILSDDGVLALSLTGSVGAWGPELSEYVGSVAVPLAHVFPDTLLSYGDPVRVFAAKADGVLAATGEALAARYRERGIESPYFDPLWFEGASDFLDPAKLAQVKRALAAQRPAHLNTDEQPAAAIYHMRYWATTSEAAHAGPEVPAERRSSLLEAILALRFEWAAGAIAAATLLAALTGLARGRRGLGRTALLWSVATTAAAALAGLARGRRGLGRTALLWSVATTGFAGMAVEIVLLYTFQTLYGYVYGMVGLVVGVFMFGLVAGSFLANRRLGRVGEDPSRRPGLRSLVALDLAVTVFAAGLVLILAALRASSADWPVQLATFGLVAVAGILGGLVFPIAACVRLGDEPRIERVAGAVSAADSLGACAGALVTGVALVPVLGISGTLLVVVTMKALSALLVGGASLTTGRLGGAVPEPG